MLGKAVEIWREWRFEPWKNQTAEGLYRRVSLVKSGLLGEVARYYADDYIVWKYLPGDMERIRKTAKGETDLMVQRYVFLQPEGENSMKKSSLMLGLRGFLEIHAYTLGSEAKSDDIKDIAYLSNAAAKKTIGV